jgi:hypothetical protein
MNSESESSHAKSSPIRIISCLAHLLACYKWVTGGAGDGANDGEVDPARVEAFRGGLAAAQRRSGRVVRRCFVLWSVWSVWSGWSG